ncbi:hypothetical protein Ancab_018854, partial [Ancistrocladus abbreviatus]
IGRRDLKTPVRPRRTAAERPFETTEAAAEAETYSHEQLKEVEMNKRKPSQEAQAKQRTENMSQEKR